MSIEYTDITFEIENCVLRSQLDVEIIKLIETNLTLRCRDTLVGDTLVRTGGGKSLQTAFSLIHSFKATKSYAILCMKITISCNKNKKLYLNMKNMKSKIPTSFFSIS